MRGRAASLFLRRRFGRFGTAGGGTGGSGLCGCNFLHLHGLAFVDGIRRVQDDPILRAEALKNFERSAVIAADGERAKMRLVIAVDDNGAKPLRAKEEGVGGDL